MTNTSRTSWLWDKGDIRCLKFVCLIGAVLLLGEWGLSNTGAVQEIYARMNPSHILPARPPHGQWVEMPASPFVDIGWKNGNFSGDRLLLAWQEAGLSARQAMILSQQMQAHFSPIVMGVNDPALERRVQAEAGLVARSWQLHWPQAYGRLRQMANDGWEPSHALNPTTLGPWRIPYEQLTKPRSQLPALREFHFSARNMPQARHALALAVARSGLKGLRLWYSDMQTPMQVEATTSGLNAASLEMQTITGWKEGVLGLYGRVFLTLRKPASDEVEGATHDQDPGQLTIEGNWDSLSHEWFHALDLHLQREAFQHPGHYALTSSIGPLRLTKQPELVEAWKQARDEIIDGQPAWKTRRWTYAIRHLDFYWVSDAETMAYAFAQHAMLSDPEVLNSSWITEIPQMRPLVPNEKEAQEQDRAWGVLLAKVRPWVEPAQRGNESHS